MFLTLSAASLCNTYDESSKLNKWMNKYYMFCVNFTKWNYRSLLKTWTQKSCKRLKFVKMPPKTVSYGTSDSVFYFSFNWDWASSKGSIVPRGHAPFTLDTTPVASVLEEESSRQMSFHIKCNIKIKNALKGPQSKPTKVRSLPKLPWGGFCFIMPHKFENKLSY